MKPRLRSFTRLGATACLLASSLFPMTGARAQTTYVVEVGRLISDGDLTKESMRFYPGNLRVHQGDIVHFKSVGFHGVALLPPGEDASQWTQDSAAGIDKPWSLFVRDPDEGPDVIKANLGVVFPSRDCGWPTEAPCDFDGRPTETGDVLGSGLALVPSGDSAEARQFDFRVEINADPGETIEVVDLVNPKMTMQIEVVAETESASDPATIAEENAELFEQDVAVAKRLHKNFSKKKKTKKVKGKVYRKVWAGVETSNISLRGMYPKTVSIKKGQGVQWVFGKNVFSAYTVTFPASEAISTASLFPVIACDPDGDVVSETADTQPVSAAAPYCNSYIELELEVPESLAPAAGDSTLKNGKDIASSGLRGAGIVSDKRAYRLLFPKPSPRSGFSYASMLHEISGVRATGKVIVRRKK